MSSNKKRRREQALKKAGRKRLIFIAAITVVVLAVTAAIVFTVLSPDDTLHYFSNTTGQSLTLKTDNTFTAVMFHNSRYTGTYVEEDYGIVFTYGINMTAVGYFIGDNQFRLPMEWDDNHGHDMTLTKR